ncbi:MAG: MBOAT family protein [Bacteroidia bacterium]|nr:MBOAT family protein [Bacteroidia bacterium]
MIFNSFEFVIFLPIVFLIYWSLSRADLKAQNVFLLIASYFFYGWWDWRFLSLIAFSTLVDFIIGKEIHRAEKPATRKLFLWISLGVNLGLLGFFKYYNFFADSLREGLLGLGIEMNTWTLEIILPVGISFYTFQTLSYSIDIYYRKLTPTNDFVSFATFVAFFPQLVAGPIERASNLLPQFFSRRDFSFKNAIQGTNLIVYGFFKKVVIADRLAIYVNSVFSNPADQNSITIALGVIFFSFQIYCDFSGYSLIARGVAKLLGFELMVNFRRPYLSQTVPEFWRRWHISLSTWFRDYVYIPLGGNRVSIPRYYANLMIVFLVSGLWHGANWTFIIWGALHGIFQVIYLIYKEKVPDQGDPGLIRRILNIVFVYALVCFAWIFFRASSVGDSFLMIEKLISFDLSINMAQLFAYEGPVNFLLSVLTIGLLFATYLLPEDLDFKRVSQSLMFNVAILLLILTLGINGETEFIYFQF